MGPLLGRDSYAGHVSQERTDMLDVLFVVLTIVFFILGAAYVAACARLE